MQVQFQLVDEDHACAVKRLIEQRIRQRQSPAEVAYQRQERAFPV